MHVEPSPTPLQRPSLLLPILIGGFAAGALDLTSAFIIYGWSVPRAIASGLLGKSAFHGGLGPWILGVFLQFFIALSAAALYCISSRWLNFLKDHFLVCGVFYGIAVFLVMNLIVVPLSAAPFKSTTFHLSGLIQGLLVHMAIIGLPISISLWKFSK
ncbi:MAG TPA: hypothetical protein VHX63_04325 [Acidobacteriaceae bacterium]|nr:hypothetical protein [Acidobacteriaceae bacterium]